METTPEFEKSATAVNDRSASAVEAGRVSKSDGFGQRPQCFRNTFQEILFVFMATIGMATNTFLVGATVIVTASVGKDLGMSQSQISWIGAATT